MARFEPTRAVALTLAAGVAASWSGAAAAQQGRPLTITAGVEVRHDSNAARASAARAQARGLLLDDFAVSPTVEIVVAKPLGRNQLNVNANAAYDFYRRNSFLNRERIGVAATGLVQAGPCAVTLAPSFNRRQSDLGTIAIPVEGGRESLRNVQTEQSYGASAECGREIGLRPVVGIRRDIANNSNAFRRITDNRRTSYTAGLGYARPTLGKLQLLYGRDEVSYPNRPRIGGGVGDGYTSNSGGVRFERAIGLNLRGAAQVNYLTLKPERIDAQDFNGVTYDIGLTATFADRLQLGVNFNRAAQPSIQTDAAYSIQRAWDLSATYQASPLLAFNASASFGQRNFEGERPTLGPLLGNDRRNLYVAGVTYDFSTRLRLIGELGYQSRNADNSFYDYNNFSQMIAVKFVY